MNNKLNVSMENFGTPRVIVTCESMEDADSIKELIKNIPNLESQIEKLQEEIYRVDDKRVQLNKALCLAQDKIQQLTNDNKILTDRLDLFKNTTEEQLRNRISDLEADNSNLLDGSARLESNNEQLTNENKELKKYKKDVEELAQNDDVWNNKVYLDKVLKEKKQLRKLVEDCELDQKEYSELNDVQKLELHIIALSDGSVMLDMEKKQLEEEIIHLTAVTNMPKNELMSAALSACDRIDDLKKQLEQQNAVIEKIRDLYKDSGNQKIGSYYWFNQTQKLEKILSQLGEKE